MMSKRTSPPRLKEIDLRSFALRLEERYPFPKPTDSTERSEKRSSEPKTA